jgi:bifunctional DNase/RNase
LDDDLVKVVDVYGEVVFDRLFVTRIVCVLEDDRYFILERVPFDIVIGLKKLRGEEIDDDRERLVDVLTSMPEVLDILGKHLRRVIINDIDTSTGVYSAIAEFSDGNMIIKRKMVPSHAIFLAKLTNKPIYVKRELVDQQEEFRELASQTDYDEEEFEEEDYSRDFEFEDEGIDFEEEE